MATPADIELLTLRLSCLGTLSWVVRGLPVVAVLEQGSTKSSKPLGQPLD